MKEIKVKATWHIIITKDFTKERNINGYISFTPIIKITIHVPYFRYFIYSDYRWKRTEHYIEDKTFGFSITEDLDKLEKVLSNGLDVLITGFHLNIDKSLNYTRIKNFYIERFLRGEKIDTRIDEEIIISEEYINKYGV